MTRLRSNKEYVFSTDQITARRHPPRTPQKRADKFVLAARNRNIRYLKQAREYQLATGDNATILGEKLRWLQAEFEAHRISGKPFRELRDLYSKRNISKPRNRRAKIDGLTDEAKEQNRRLEDAFAQGPRSGADAGDEVSGAVSGNAVEGILERTGGSEDRSSGETESEETDDESSSEEESSSSEDGSSAPKAAVPTASRNPYGDNFAADATAIEQVRLLGIPLSESYGGEPLQSGEEEYSGGELPVKREPNAEEAEAPIKMEPNEEE